MTVHLNRKLVLEERSGPPDGAGGVAAGWISLGVLWGQIEPYLGRFERGEGHARSRVPHRITIRAVAPDSPARPRAGQRFREGQRVYAIRSVHDRSTDARFLECLADEEISA